MSEPKYRSYDELDDQTKEQIRLFKAGPEKWNVWAQSLLERKEVLKKAGKWKMMCKYDYYTDTIIQDRFNVPSIEMSEWLKDATVDFSTLNTKKNLSNYKIDNQAAIDFSGYKFPGPTKFASAVFDCPVNFIRAEFFGSVNFQKAVFKQNVIFNAVKFHDIAAFTYVEFEGSVYFHKSRFFKDAIFKEIKTQKKLEFFMARFLAEADFNSGEFLAELNFYKSRFYKATNYRLVNFKAPVMLDEAEFHDLVDFSGMLSSGLFSMGSAKFNSNIPNFTQAIFSESPRLDHVEVIPDPSFKNYSYPAGKIESPLKWQRYWWNLQFRAFMLRAFWRSVFKLTPSNYRKLYHKGEVLKHIWRKFRNKRNNPDEEAHYRALKRLAIQAHDHENEMKFFAGEIRARRHITDFMWPWKKGFASSARYWAGFFYEIFSDFGRSFIRPALWWFACLWLFANLTLSNAGLQDKTKCHNSQLTPKEAAYTIGLKNSLLILGLTKTNIVKQAELCLYGVNKNGIAEREQKPYDPKVKRAYQAKPTKAETTKTDIPFKAMWQGITHSLLSLLFIFLLLLAIRNQFKIK